MQTTHRFKGVVSAGILALAFGLALAQPGLAQSDHWVATWATAAQIYRAPAPPAPQASAPTAQTAPAPASPKPAAPATPARPRAPQAFNNQTVRMVVHTSLGGKRLRLQLTNPFGGTAVDVGSAHVALREKDSAIVPASDRTLTVGGSRTFRMIPGQTVITDPVDLEFVPLSDLAVSLYFPTSTGPLATHSLGLHTTYISGDGDFTSQAAIAEPITTTAYYWISAIDVMAPADAAAIVTLGDSITDGAASTANADRMWPARLAARLQANKATANVAVVNEGISGNRILMDGSGVAAVARLDHDVLIQAGAKWLMILEGINDIGNQTRVNTGLTSADLITALRQIAERAHTRGMKVVGCTLTPYAGAGYYSDAGEAMREAENDFIRNSGVFDAVVDFDAAVRDPKDPKHFRADMHSGDNLHPSDAGYQVMADAVDLAIFAAKK